MGSEVEDPRGFVEGPPSSSEQPEGFPDGQDVLIGQVWLCSGQSNMNWSAANGVVDMKQEATGKLNPQIRLFTVTKNSSPIRPRIVCRTLGGDAMPSALYFSAVGYFFGKRLAEDSVNPSDWSTRRGAGHRSRCGRRPPP